MNYPLSGFMGDESCILIVYHLKMEPFLPQVLPAIVCWISALVGHIKLYDTIPRNNGYLVNSRLKLLNIDIFIVIIG